jgi:hypothetical protein
MSGTAPANQLRLSFTGSKDGEAETETCRAAKPLWRTTNRTSGPRGLNSLNRRMRTRMYGGVAGESGRPLPLCRLRGGARRRVPNSKHHHKPQPCGNARLPRSACAQQPCAGLGSGDKVLTIRLMVRIQELKLRIAGSFRSRLKPRPTKRRSAKHDLQNRQAQKRRPTKRRPTYKLAICGETYWLLCWANEW